MRNTKKQRKFYRRSRHRRQKYNIKGGVRHQNITQQILPTGLPDYMYTYLKARLQNNLLWYKVNHDYKCDKLYFLKTVLSKENWEKVAETAKKTPGFIGSKTLEGLSGVYNYVDESYKYRNEKAKKGQYFSTLGNEGMAKLRNGLSSAKLYTTWLFNVSNIDRMVIKNHYFSRFFDHKHVIENVYRNSNLTITYDDKQDKYIAKYVDGIRKDYEFGLSYMLVNDAALVDRHNVNLSTKNKEKSWVVFDDKYDAFYRYLHLLKYQLKRILWTPHGIITMKYLIQLIVLQNEMLLKNPQLMEIYRDKATLFFLSIAQINGMIPKKFRQTLLDTYTYSIANNDTSTINSINDQFDGVVKEVATDMKNTGENTSSSSSADKNEYDPNSATLHVGSMDTSEARISNSDEIKGGLITLTTRYTDMRIFRKLKKFYDIKDKIKNARSFNLKNKVMTERYPKYAETEAKYAVIYAICVLKKLLETNNYVEAELRKIMGSMNKIEYGDNNESISFDDLIRVVDLDKTNISDSDISKDATKFINYIANADISDLVEKLASLKKEFEAKKTKGGKQTQKRQKRKHKRVHRKTQKVGGFLGMKMPFSSKKKTPPTTFTDINDTNNTNAPTNSDPNDTTPTVDDANVTEPPKKSLLKRFSKSVYDSVSSGVSYVYSKSFDTYFNFLNTIFDETYQHMIKRIINRMIVIGKNNPTKSENSQLNSSQTIGQKVQFNNFKYKQNKNDVVNTVTDVEIKDYMLDKSNNATADNMYATAEDLGIFLSSTICKTMLLQIQICVFGILTNITAFFRVYSWHCYLSMLIVLRLYANCLVLTRENCEKIQNVLNDGIHGHIRGDYMNYTLTELHNAYQIVKNKKVDIKQIQNMNPDTTNNAANTNAANTNAAKGGYDQHGGIVNLFQSAPYQPVRELFLSVCIENQNKNGDESIIFKDEDSKAGMFKSDSIIGTIERIRYIQNCIDIKKNAYMIWGSVLRKSKNLQNAELMNNISGSDDNDNKNTNSTEVADAIDIDPSIIEKVPLGDVYYEYVRIKTTDVASSVFSGKHVGVENINEILGPTQKKNTYLATIKPLIKYEKTKTNGKYNVITLKDIQTQVMSKKQNLERAPYFRPIVIPDPSSVDIDEWNAWKENNNKWYVSLEDVYGDNYYMYDDVLGKIYGYYEKYTNMFGIEIYIHCEFSTQRAGGYETITQGKDGNGESHDVSNKYKVDNNESSSSSSDNTNNTNTNANGDEDVVSQENAPVVPNRQATHFKLFQVSPHKNYEILQKILSSLKKLTANEIQKTLGEASQTESDSDVNIMIPDTSEEYAKYITEQAQLLINKQNNESKGNSTT